MWHGNASTKDEFPDFIREHVDERMSEGVSWKFVPLQLFADRYELALDNDCIMWGVPEAFSLWLAGRGDRWCVFAEDVCTCLGQFTDLCDPEPRNSGTRGLHPGFDLEGAMREVFLRRPVKLTSELDEQGLQAAAISLVREPLVVTVEEVTICSPFPPHLPFLGRCGAHFVGLNAKQLSWKFHGRPATELIRELGSPTWRIIRPCRLGASVIERDARTQGQ